MYACYSIFRFIHLDNMSSDEHTRNFHELEKKRNTIGKKIFQYFIIIF